MARVERIKTESEILSTFATVNQLRPHLTKDGYVKTIKRLMDTYEYTLVAVIEEAQVKAVAGYRLSESLAWGKYLYVDDLITDKASRRIGYAQLLWDWLYLEADKHECEQFHLDSGVNRHEAHRFYLKTGLAITCHHFEMNVINKDL
ncbi:GNAT family N-acetyltransferase [Halalkalibacter urbisdiaboli]|uniref:GNAT family N-acetyltransferase n=1 Tax=Halalkalibacter urbisdiaboli TaxID=1960589 RepID=UPI000B433FF0|nr:GNAT family N-acetyltransferase [Halalkalibacter urbisdiaboli]